MPDAVPDAGDRTVTQTGTVAAGWNFMPEEEADEFASHCEAA